MGIKDLFKRNEYKSLSETLEKENTDLKTKIEEQEAVLTDKHQQAIDINRYIASQKEEVNKWEKIIEEKKTLIEELEESANTKRTEINKLQAAVIELEDEVLLQDFGLYKPTYDFATSQEYKSRLDDCRNQQKELIRSGSAATCYVQWSVDGNRAKGKKMTNDNIKQTIMVFNTECENAVNKVTFSNFDSMKNALIVHLIS